MNQLRVIGQSKLPAVPGYRHTQKAPWFLLVYAAGAVYCIILWLIHEPLFAPHSIGVLVIVILGSSFHHLTVVDEGDRLAIRFGPLPLFRKRIIYADMKSAEVRRTLLADGWGIHYSFWGGGWVWNIWGRSCVFIRHSSTTWLGTDDAENLTRFLRTKMATQGVSP